MPPAQFCSSVQVAFMEALPPQPRSGARARGRNATSAPAIAKHRTAVNRSEFIFIGELSCEIGSRVAGRIKVYPISPQNASKKSNRQIFTKRREKVSEIL